MSVQYGERNKEMDNNFNRVSTTAERLRQRMSELGLKQVDLVRATGIDKGSISYYLSGKYEPKDKAVYKLARALNVNEMWLWGYDVQKERPERDSEEIITIPGSLKDKSHLAADIVIRLGNDDAFCESVSLLYVLDEKDLHNVTEILRSLVK